MDRFRIKPPTPAEIAQVEQTYAKAAEQLDILINDVMTDIPTVTENIGLSDGSVVFQYVLSYIHHIHRTDPMSVMQTAALLAAAATRLARTARGDDIDMSQFEQKGYQ